MPESFNLDALVVEETKEPFRFIFGGEEYELPADPDVFASVHLEAGRTEAGLRRLLGSDQWTRLTATEATMTQPKLEALFVEYRKHLGIDLGKSRGFTGSSRSTVKPSKRTSSGTTRPR